MASFSIHGMAVCGIKELSNISSLPTPEDVVKETARLLPMHTVSYEANPAFLLFSGVVGKRERVYSEAFHADRNDDYGQALADYIRERDLGTVTEVPPAKNHSGNMLKVFLWAPRWEALREIWLANKPASATAAVSDLVIAPARGNLR